MIGNRFQVIGMKIYRMISSELLKMKSSAMTIL